MGTQQRDQPLGREVFGRQGMVHVGRSGIPPWTVAVAGTEARTLCVQPHGQRFGDARGDKLYMIAKGY